MHCLSKIFISKMRLRYNLWFAYIILIHLFCWYYVICFCAIYPNNSLLWFYGSIISICLDWFIIGILPSIFLSIIRKIAKRFIHKKYIAYTYYFVRKITNLIC